MSTAAMTLRQVRFQNKAFWRNPAAAIFTFVFPMMFLVIFNALFGEAQFFVPGIAAFSIVTACYTNMAMSITIVRDEGLLKRMRGTPMPPGAYMGSRIIHSILIAYTLVAIIAVFGTLFYGVELPTSTLPAFLLSVGLCGAAFCAMGLSISSAIPNADAAPAIVNALVIPASFVSDVFVPSDEVPPWLRTLADVLPLKHAVNTMDAAFNPVAGQSAYQWTDLGIVAAWGVFGLLMSLKFFRWEPRR